MPAIIATYNETSLLKALAAGSDTAFASIYQQYWKKIYAVSVSYLKDSWMAEDVVQETFLRIWQKRSSLTEINNFPAYLHVIARNLIISALRKKICATGDGRATAALVPDKSWLPVEQLEDRDNEAMLNKALNRLSPKQKQIYVLSREKETPLKDLAHKMNITYDTARQYKSEAMQFIRFFLKHNACLVFLLPFFY